MKISIIELVNEKPYGEGILLEVLADTNLSQFMIMDNTFQNGVVSNKERHIYWFSNQKVSKGNFVVLLTGKGENESVMGDDGILVHLIFWNLDHDIWNNDGDRAVLIQIDDFESKKVSEIK